VNERDRALILPPVVRIGPDTLTAAFLAGRNARTLDAYRRDLEDFRAFLGVATATEAGRLLVTAAQGDANAVAHAYRSQLIERGLQPATINRRLAALRSLVRLANTVGLIPWRLSVRSLASQVYRDTRGPGGNAYQALLAIAAGQPARKAARDVAILRLLHDIGLRRGELVDLDLADVDLARSSVMVRGKGRTQTAPITLPAPTQAALQVWIAERGNVPGPLFTNFDRARKGSGRLTGAAIYQLVRGFGVAVGATVRPHGLRHLAITRALDLFNGDIRKVAQFSRHRDIRVLTVYDDNRLDSAGEVAAAVAQMSLRE
jgi:integrase/recombinase XerC